MKGKKLGFALGSGGSRGVAHIGFLRATEEAGIRPDFVTGSSMGAIVGGCYAAGVTVEEMQEIVLKLRPFDILDPTLKAGGLFDTRKIRKLLGKYIGDITFDELKIPFRCVAVDLCSQELCVLSEGSVREAVIASACIPGVFKPLEMDGRRYVDGGVLERVPVSQLKEMGAERIVAVDVLGRLQCRAKRASAFMVLSQMLDLMDNQRIEARRKAHEKDIDLWIEPQLGYVSQYSFKRLPFVYDEGYKAGKAYAEKILELVKER